MRSDQFVYRRPLLMQCLVRYSLHAFLNHSPLNFSYWWVWVINKNWPQIISILLLIGQFQLEQQISELLFDGAKWWSIYGLRSDRSLCFRFGPVPGHSDPPPLSQHRQQNKTDRGLSLCLGIRSSSCCGKGVNQGDKKERAKQISDYFLKFEATEHPVFSDW